MSKFIADECQHTSSENEKRLLDMISNSKNPSLALIEAVRVITEYLGENPAKEDC